MPVPMEYNNVRRMSTFTAPIYDISFDTYDFQLCQPQSDVKDSFECRDLEASYCRDFSCCGLILNDLHDLLQHYEECHVPLDEDAVLYDDDDIEGDQSNESDFGSTTLNDQLQHDYNNDGGGDDDDDDDKELACFANSQDLDMTHLKKKAAMYLMNLYQQPPLTDDDSGDDDNNGKNNNYESLKREDDLVDQTTTTTTTTTSITTGKKRTFGQSNAVNLMTQTAVKKLALATNMISASQPCDIDLTSSCDANGGGGDCDGDTMLELPCFTSDYFLAHAGALLASSTQHALQNADKPYKCDVKGCSKTYKNPNGLKYHNQHGHCNLVTDENENVASKPYQCTIGNCGKRYKNLNGLKYHFEHSHMPALNHTLATFGTAFFQHNQQQLQYLPYQQQQQASSTCFSASSTPPSLSPSSSPELSCLSPIF